MKAFPVPESKEEITIPTEQRNISVPWTGIIGIAFLTGSGICLTTTILSFGKMYQLTRKNRKLKQGKYTLILTPDPVSPFSWGRYIFLSENDYRNHPNEILMHEKMHLRYSCSDSVQSFAYNTVQILRTRFFVGEENCMILLHRFLIYRTFVNR
jgi:hypothetical protein